MRSLLFLGLLLAGAGDEARRPRPPAQPADGPGGRDYRHAAVLKTVYGAGGDEYWLFEPRAPRPRDPVPLVVFLHGWSVLDPAAYGAWIDHLVRSGNVVCAPRYQESLASLPGEFLPNTLLAVRDALRHLDGDWHLRFDPARTAYVGHSMGALLAVNLAACAEAEGLPAPRALFLVQPGLTRSPLGELQPLRELERIRAGTLLLAVVGDRDTVVGDADARRILRATTSLPAADKDLLLLPSDEHGRPALRAHHLAPHAHDGRYEPRADYGEPRRGLDVDALDWYGLWRPLDLLLAAAFGEGPREAALGDAPERFTMGRWSDGRAVRPLRRLAAR